MNNETTKVVDLLKESLYIHWQQASTLYVQANHLNRWGYLKRSKMTFEDAEQEVDHANVVLERLQFFGVDPQDFVVKPYTWTPFDMKATIESNLKSVQEAAECERSIILAARETGDEFTANMVIPLLKGSEDGIIQFQQELKLIEQMGIDNFLTLQV